MSYSPDEWHTFVKYQADVWVEVDRDEAAVIRVVVDTDSMLQPVTFVDADGIEAPFEIQRDVARVVDTDTWPSWDFGSNPIRHASAMDA